MVRSLFPTPIFDLTPPCESVFLVFPAFVYTNTLMKPDRPHACQSGSSGSHISCQSGSESGWLAVKPTMQCSFCRQRFNLPGICSVAATHFSRIYYLLPTNMQHTVVEWFKSFLRMLFGLPSICSESDYISGRQKIDTC